MFFSIGMTCKLAITNLGRLLIKKRMHTLNEWQSFIFQNRASSRQENFEDVLALAKDLDLTQFSVPVISVTGTNGKGSCVAVLESILTQAGYKVGAYTSPHLFEFNERVRISGRNVSDEKLCEAFEWVEKKLTVFAQEEGRAQNGLVISSANRRLNFFSFITLAALLVFKKERCDVILLEVGIGGRLDATNVVDNDVVVMTTVAKDHCEILGSSIEDIAYEKAGLIKKNKAVVFGDEPVPQAVVDRACEMEAALYSRSSQYSYSVDNNTWSWHHGTLTYHHLPIPSVLLTNAASALMALTYLKLNISENNIHRGLSTVFLPCRCQVIPGDVITVLDVAHNEQAAEWLAKTIIELKPRKVWAVFSVLGRKDVKALLKPLKPIIHRWFIAPMQDPESATIEHLSRALLDCDVVIGDSIAQASAAAKAAAEKGDVIIIFGSFRLFQEIQVIYR